MGWQRSSAPWTHADNTGAMQDFAPMVRQIKREQAIRVRRWRKPMSGCSWQVRYADGRIERWIEAPFPKSPISLAIFLHEVGHHVIGFDTYKLRCEEEYHVWKWAIERMKSLEVEPDEKVLSRFERSMQYAVGKALRRRIKDLPEVLRAFASDTSEMTAPQSDKMLT